MLKPNKKILKKLAFLKCVPKNKNYIPKATHHPPHPHTIEFII
jgi:hypothetical protein